MSHTFGVCELTSQVKYQHSPHQIVILTQYHCFWETYSLLSCGARSARRKRHRIGSQGHAVPLPPHPREQLIIKVRCIDFLNLTSRYVKPLQRLFTAVRHTKPNSCYFIKQSNLLPEQLKFFVIVSSTTKLSTLMLSNKCGHSIILHALTILSQLKQRFIHKSTVDFQCSCFQPRKRTRATDIIFSQMENFEREGERARASEQSSERKQNNYVFGYVDKISSKKKTIQLLFYQS